MKKVGRTLKKFRVQAWPRSRQSPDKGPDIPRQIPGQNVRAPLTKKSGNSPDRQPAPLVVFSHPCRGEIKIRQRFTTTGAVPCASVYRGLMILPKAGRQVFPRSPVAAKSCPFFQDRSPGGKGTCPHREKPGPLAEGTCPFCLRRCPFSGGTCPFPEKRRPLCQQPRPFRLGTCPFAKGTAPFCKGTRVSSPHFPPFSEKT
jgi:hypothetical protein